MAKSVQCREGFEVANDGLGTESVLGYFAIDLDVLADRFGCGAQVLEQASGAVETASEIAQRQPVDLFDAKRVLFTKSFLEKAVSPLGHDDSDLVSADTR